MSMKPCWSRKRRTAIAARCRRRRLRCIGCAPQVEDAVLQTRFFGEVFLVQLKRRRRRGIEDLDLVRERPRLRRWAARDSPCPRAGGAPCRSRAGRTRSARARPGAKASLRSGSHTTCASPSRSRRSMKITPPWSRRRCAQPHSVTVRSTSVASQLAAVMTTHRGVYPSFLRRDDAHRNDVLECLVDAHVELDHVLARA